VVNLACVLGNARDQTVPAAVYADVLAYCIERRALLIVDPPVEWRHDKLLDDAEAHVHAFGLTGEAARSAAAFYPRILAADPQREGQVDTSPRCGAIAGMMARTDAATASGPRPQGPTPGWWVRPASPTTCPTTSPPSSTGSL
jgi:uncharacterized protein